MLSTLLIRDKETRDSYRGLSIAAFLVLAFVVSGFRSCTQIKYSLWGVPTTARVMSSKVLEMEENLGKADVSYQYVDDEGEKHERSYRTRKGDVIPERGASMEILYLSTSSGASIAASERTMAPIALFIGIGLAVVLWAWLQVRAIG